MGKMNLKSFLDIKRNMEKRLLQNENRVSVAGGDNKTKLIKGYSKTLFFFFGSCTNKLIPQSYTSRCPLFPCPGDILIMLKCITLIFAF